MRGRLKTREEKRVVGGPAKRRDSLGDIKEDLKVFQAPWVSSEGASSQAEDRPYLERIAQIIEEDKSLPKKQSHTTTRAQSGRLRQKNL